MFASVGVESGEVAVASVVPPTEQAAIDQALQLVYAENRRLSGLLGLAPAHTPSLADLRRSPLGIDLQRLADYGLGRTNEQSDDVLVAVESTLQVLFWPTAASDYTIPGSFWRTILGRLLARAKQRALATDGFLGIAAAARLLGVDHGTVERWIDDRLLDSVPTASGGRTLIGRRSVERLLEVAAELPEDRRR